MPEHSSKLDGFDSKSIQFIKKTFCSPWRFRLLLMKILPMGFLSKMKVTHLDETSCSVSVPYSWRNKNPFQSTFWAVLGMAAEMSSGALLTLYTFKQKPEVAMIIVGCRAKFVKKAKDITTFICPDGVKIRSAIEATRVSGEAVQVECNMNGTNRAGETVAQFSFTWSVKMRQS